LGPKWGPMGTKWAPESTKTRYKTAFCIEDQPRTPQREKMELKSDRTGARGHDCRCMSDQFEILFGGVLFAFYCLFQVFFCICANSMGIYHASISTFPSNSKTINSLISYLLVEICTGPHLCSKMCVFQGTRLGPALVTFG